MNNVWRVAIKQIEIAEQLMEGQGKHLIRTDSIRERIKDRMNLAGVDDDSDYLVDVGIGQVIQSVLYSRDYRSVQTGYFVNLAKCDNPTYLNRLLANAETAEDAKTRIRMRIKELREQACDQQYRFDINGNIIKPMTPEEFDRMLEEDAI